MEVENSTANLDDEMIRDLLKERKFSILVQKCQVLNLTKSYQKMKYDKIIYKIGQDIQISNETNKKFKFYGRLMEFITIKLKDHLVPMFKLKMYQTKYSINTKQKDILDGLSDFELFSTDKEEWHFCMAIDHEINILTLQEYENRVNLNVSERLYFTRAAYDQEMDKFTPPTSKWGKICFCNQVSNPDKDYIQCDLCEKWLHQKCAGLKKSDAEKLDKFYCVKCDKKKKK